MNRDSVNIAVLIPVYNHGGALDHVLDQLESFQYPCLLVDDGSDDACQAVISNAICQRSWVSGIRLDENQGKGAAVKAGLMALELQGFTHAIQIDADGQHNLQDIPRFVQQLCDKPHALVLGQAQYDSSVPKSRLYGRYITHTWVWIETLSLAIKDTMCGFRVYPIAETNQLIRESTMGQRMSFDTEVAVRLYWRNIDIVNIPTLVQYPLDGVSHFDVLRDNVQISFSHTRLFLGMLMRLPVWLVKRTMRRLGFV